MLKKNSKNQLYKLFDLEKMQLYTYGVACVVLALKGDDSLFMIVGIVQVEFLAILVSLSLVLWNKDRFKGLLQGSSIFTGSFFLFLISLVFSGLLNPYDKYSETEGIYYLWYSIYLHRIELIIFLIVFTLEYYLPLKNMGKEDKYYFAQLNVFRNVVKTLLFSIIATFILLSFKENYLKYALLAVLGVRFLLDKMVKSQMK